MPDVYKSIVKAVKSGKLKEPFSKEDIYKACKADDLKKSTCNSYPTKQEIHTRKKNFLKKYRLANTSCLDHLRMDYDNFKKDSHIVN